MVVLEGVVATLVTKHKVVTTLLVVLVLLEKVILVVIQFNQTVKTLSMKMEVQLLKDDVIVAVAAVAKVVPVVMVLLGPLVVAEVLEVLAQSQVLR